MKKIISLYKRDYETTRLVYNEVVPGAEWVFDDEGEATIKIDGTSCLYRKGVLYKRYDAKAGRKPPDGWEPCEAEPDAHTGHWPGWVPVGDSPEDRWHREGLANLVAVWHDIREWTYELIGPKVQGNPYREEHHFLIRHGAHPVYGVPVAFDALRQWFEGNEVEGLVWWRDLKDPDCDKVKIKRRDFGLPWPTKNGRY